MITVPPVGDLPATVFLVTSEVRTHAEARYSTPSSTGTLWMR